MYAMLLDRGLLIGTLDDVEVVFLNSRYIVLRIMGADLAPVILSLLNN